MKFTDGYWADRAGVSAQTAKQMADAEASGGLLRIRATAKKSAGRGDTLNSTLLTVEFSSPAEDVIRVRIVHHDGLADKIPAFALAAAAGTPGQAALDEDAAAFSSGRLSIRVPRAAPWRVEFLGDGRPLTTSGLNGMGILDVEGFGRHLRDQLSLSAGECVYGLGERFTAFVKNGQSIEMWNHDGGAGSDQAYKNIPFYLTNRGYGVFVNQPERVSFEVASERPSRVQFSVPGESLEYFLIYGPTPKEVLEKYTALTGRPALPPPWSFGLWLTTSFTTTYDEKTVTEFIQGMADRSLPLQVFHFDCFWMEAYHWCNFAWDTKSFPDPQGMLARLKERGLHICVWINPYIAQPSELFAEAARQGFLLKRSGGGIWQTDWWQPGMGIVDFTNPAAREWFGAKLRALLEMGVDCFKTDFGESIPTDAIFFDGSDPLRMHNYYSFLYNRTVFDILREHRGEGEAVLFARSASAGSQRFPVHWGGDCESTFEAMAESLRAGLSLGLSGFGFWSHDIGGFTGTPSPALYKRWVAFGLLSSHSRLHGDASYRVPWLFDEESVDVLRTFATLKNRLMPYLYAQACEAARKGLPLMRAMMLEFPRDPACDTLDREYMLGESLLVAPVFTEEGEVSYYLPEGRWTDYFSGEIVEGPGWKRARHGFSTLPLYVRPNTVIAIGKEGGRPDYDYSEDITLQAYALLDDSPVVVHIPTAAGDAESIFTVEKKGRAIHARRKGAKKRWNLMLMGVDGKASCDGGKVKAQPSGLLASANPGEDRLTITLSNGG